MRAFLRLDISPARQMETMFHRMRTLPLILPWLTGATSVLASAAIAGQSPSQASSVEISPARSAVLVSACRSEAEKQAVPARGLHAIRWDKAAPPEVTGSRSRSRVLASVSLAGWALSGDDWVPITAQCRFDGDRRGVASVDVLAAPLAGRGLDLSGITTLSELPAQPGATLPSDSAAPPPSDPSKTSGSPTLAPIFQQTAPPAPYINKDQDFLHDHRFGIELRTPF